MEMALNIIRNSLLLFLICLSVCLFFEKKTNSSIKCLVAESVFLAISILLFIAKFIIHIILHDIFYALHTVFSIIGCIFIFYITAKQIFEHIYSE